MIYCLSAVYCKTSVVCVILLWDFRIGMTAVTLAQTMFGNDMCIMPVCHYSQHYAFRCESSLDTPCELPGDGC